MKFVSENGRVFENAADCLRYEGSCQRGRGDGGGCLLFIGAVIGILMMIL